MNVTLPASIKDATTAAIVSVLNERFNAVPVENVLVWKLDTAVDAAVPEIATFLGLDGPEFGIGSGPPRTLVRQGVALCRKRGTRGAIREVLRRLDFGEVVFVIDGRRVHDGTIFHDGAWLHGDPAWFRWAVFGLIVTTADAMSADRLRQLWDAVDEWKSKRDWFFLIVHGPASTVTPYRDRSEII